MALDLWTPEDAPSEEEIDDLIANLGEVLLEDEIFDVEPVYDPMEHVCLICGERMLPQKAKQSYCGSKCEVKAALSALPLKYPASKVV